MGTGGEVSLGARTLRFPIESTDAMTLGSPTINGDAAKPIWDLLSSLAVIDLKGKLGAAFGYLRLPRV